MPTGGQNGEIGFKSGKRRVAGRRKREKCGVVTLSKVVKKAEKWAVWGCFLAHFGRFLQRDRGRLGRFRPCGFAPRTGYRFRLGLDPCLSDCVVWSLSSWGPWFPKSQGRELEHPAMVKVLPDPVTPSSTWCFSPAASPFIS